MSHFDLVAIHKFNEELHKTEYLLASYQMAKSFPALLKNKHHTLLSLVLEQLQKLRTMSTYLRNYQQFFTSIPTENFFYRYFDRMIDLLKQQELKVVEYQLRDFDDQLSHLLPIIETEAIA
ncbi:hypothetical protein [Streptococcus moroccensis]|uniref:Uncharacterized protein n=1 Tax=Streptococcus moroccensis TaxID=1451356 RepID=A0ABT9YQU0_9STRE|nr:hypothetical protein [Streptococcus moroccensis]MDQ0222257.1 hypothetical protein [Streptococcus moroccensis]